MPDVVGVEPKPKKKKVHTTTSALKLAAKKREQITDDKPAWNNISHSRIERDKQKGLPSLRQQFSPRR